MKKILALLLIVVSFGIQSASAECTVRLPCSDSVNDFVECDGNKCERIKGTYQSQNKVKCDGVITSCTEENPVIGGI